MPKQIYCEVCDTEIEIDEDNEVTGDVNCMSIDCPYQDGIEDEDDEVKELDFTEGC